MKSHPRYPTTNGETDLSFARWLHDLEQLTFAFQPIVHPVTGIPYGMEALVRGVEKIGFASPKELFDAAFHDRSLFFVDIRLREKAIARFREIPFHRKLILFYNYDPRILEMPDYRPGVTERLMTNFDLSCDQICFEINEKYQIQSNDTLNGFVRNLQQRGIKIALDDFGSGYAGFELFYHSEPNLLKFDRFLISNIQSDSRKKNLCTHMVSLCKMQGVTTIAEGIETEAEFNVCRAIGFDLVQGYFVQKPVIDISLLQQSYEAVSESARPAPQRDEEDTQLVSRSILRLETISIDDDVRTLLDKFQNQSISNFFPILDANNYPLGIIHEKTLKQYIYSPFGKELLSNRSVTRGLRNFVTPNPVADIHTPQDKILEIFISNPDCEGVIILRNMKYLGFLNAKSLLSMINEKKIAAARDTSPLTGLPGNRLIHEFITEALENVQNCNYLVYFDFDHFKPFNDRFGFRQGDRALTLFARILRDAAPPGSLAGHIGGDDFFLGLTCGSAKTTDILHLVEVILRQFTHEVRPFFTPEEREQGFYTSNDRDNAVKNFPLLEISAAIIELAPHCKPQSTEEISLLLAKLKKTAKANLTRMDFLSYRPEGRLVTNGIS